MIIDRYVSPENFNAPSLSDPILQELDWILDDPYLFALVRQDLAQHYNSVRKPDAVLCPRKRFRFLERQRQREFIQLGLRRYSWFLRVHDTPPHIISALTMLC